MASIKNPSSFYYLDQGGGGVRPTTNYFVIFQLGSGQLLTLLWLFNRGPAKY